MVKQKALFLGLDNSKFGTDLLRGGGSSLAANAGVPDRLFQKHGRWSSVSCKDGYITDSLEKRLSVTKHMK